MLVDVCQDLSGANNVSGNSEDNAGSGPNLSTSCPAALLVNARCRSSVSRLKNTVFGDRTMKESTMETQHLSLTAALRMATQHILL